MRSNRSSKWIGLCILFAAGLGGCGHNARPPFDFQNATADTFIGLIEWLASIRDLSDYAIVAQGLNLAPHPKVYSTEQNGVLVPNGMDVFPVSPLWNGSASKIYYRIFFPDGTAAKMEHERSGFIPVAQLVINVKQPGTCLGLKEFRSEFGSPTDTFMLTDFGGYSYRWLVRDVSGRDTYIAAYFGTDDRSCDPEVTLSQVLTGR